MAYDRLKSQNPGGAEKRRQRSRPAITQARQAQRKWVRAAVNSAGTWGEQLADGEGGHLFSIGLLSRMLTGRFDGTESWPL